MILYDVKRVCQKKKITLNMEAKYSFLTNKLNVYKL